jgi:hypothetical protein
MKSLATRPALALSLALLGVWVLWGKSRPVICNDGSRLATIESLAERSTFDISDSMFVDTCDKVRIDGRYYSDKPPLLALAGAGIYRVLRGAGLDARRDVAPAYRWLTFLLVVLPALSIFPMADLWLRAKGASLEARWWTLVVAGFGTLELPYVTTLNSHVPAAAAVLAAFVLVDLVPLGAALSLPLAGLLIGFSTAIELHSGFYALPLAWFVYRRYWSSARPGTRAGALGFCALSAAPVLVQLVLNYGITGRLAPVGVQADSYLFPGARHMLPYLVGEKAAALLTWNGIARFLWHGSVGYRGVLSHSVALVLGFAGLWKFGRESAERAEVAWGVFLPIIPPVVFLTFDGPLSYGGSCYGFRYMIFWMPLVALFFSRLLRDGAPAPWMKMLVGISVLTSAGGLGAPWLVQPWANTDVAEPDFLRAMDDSENPYRMTSPRDENTRERLAELRRELGSPEALVNLAALELGLGRASEALGHLQLRGELGARDWHCPLADVFASRLGLPDLAEKHRALCAARVEVPPEPRAGTAAAAGAGSSP